MRPAFSGYKRKSAPGLPAIGISASAIDETAGTGTLVGTLVLPGAEWTARLADDANGMFRLAGSDLVVGSTPLRHDAAPEPKVLVAASNGLRATASLLTITVRRALPALPFASGARVAAIGDSQIGYNNGFGGAVGTGGSNVGFKAAISTGYGFIGQARSIDQRFRFDNWFDAGDPRGLNYVGANQGHHGDHLEWAQAGFGGGILGRLPAVLARRPDILILEGGINTMATGDDGRAGTAAYVVARLERALRIARNAGVWTIPMTLYPRGDWLGTGDPKAAILDEVNAWIRAQAGREGVVAILDAEDILRPGGVFDATMFRSDMIHLGTKGALALGRDKLLPILRGAIQAGSTFDKNPGAANLLPAAIHTMPGTGGIRQQNGVTNGAGSPTGSVATGYTLNIGRNCAVVASKEVIEGALEAQVMAITPGGSQAAAYAELTLTGMVAMESADPQQWYQMFLELETSGDGLSFAQLQGGHRTGTGATVTQTIALGRESSSDYASGMGGGARTFWLQTEPFQTGEAYDRIGMSLLMTFSKTAAPFTVKTRRPIIRRVPDPRPLWRY